MLYANAELLGSPPETRASQWLTCQRKRHARCRFDRWVRKTPWKRKWQPTLVFLPGKFPWTEEPGGLQSMWSQRVRLSN